MKTTILILLLTVMVQGDVYRVPNFNGGINASTDSVDMPVNQAVDIFNFVLDKDGVLSSRLGYHYWNTTALPAGGTIDAICDYEYAAGSFKRVIIKYGFIYIAPSLTDPGAVNWDTLRLGFSGDSLNVTNGSSTTYEYDKDVHLLINVCSDDVIIMDDDTSGTEYNIDGIGGSSDSTIALTINYKGATDTKTNYTIYKRMLGTPSITQHENKLYISSSEGIPIVYDGSAGTYQFTSLVDTGYIDTAYAVTDSTFIYSDGCVDVTRGSNAIVGQQADFTSANGVVAGKVIKISGEVTRLVLRDRGHTSGGVTENVTWAEYIDSVDENLNTIYTASVWTYSSVTCLDYKILNPLGKFNTDATHVVVDRSKNWHDSDFDTDYLQEFIMITDKTGESNTVYLYNSTDSTVATSSSIGTGHYYYIFNRAPYGVGTNASQYFDQVLFKDGVMYAFGTENASQYIGNYDDALNRVWYSAIDMPFYMKPTRYFNLGVAEDITCMFSLRNGTYIATTNSIWRMTGNPWYGDLSYRMVVSGIGIKSIDSFVKSSNEYIYFIDNLGIYRFDGIRTEKISHNIDPYIDYVNSYTQPLGYFDEKLYIGAITSLTEAVYDEFYSSYLSTNITMDAFYVPSDTNIFLFSDGSRICYYPDDCYFDSSSSSSGGYPQKRYETGWFTPGGVYNPDINSTYKKIEKIIWTITTDSVVTFYAYKDFDTTPFDTITFDTVGTYVYNITCDNRWDGEYFKLKMNATRGNITLRPYEVHYRWLPALKK